MKELDRIIVVLFLITIGFIACKKNSDDKQISNSTNLTIEEKSYLNYEVSDSLVFGEYYYDDFIEDSVSYKITSKTENANSVEYDFQGIDDYNGNLLLEKKDGEINIVLTFIRPNTVNFIIEKVSGRLDSFTVNDHDYSDILLIEKDSTQNQFHHCNIFRAYVAKNEGIVQIQKDCYVYKLVKTYYKNNKK